MAVSEVRRQLGRFGVYIPSGVLASTPVAILRKELARIERLGYGSVSSAATRGLGGCRMPPPSDVSAVVR